MIRSRGFVAALIFSSLLVIPSVAHAADSEFRVLLDVDHDAASGCTISGMPGVDQVFTTRVTTTETTASVTRTVRQVCTTAGFGPIIDIETSGWPAGFQPANGNVTIETRIPFSAFASTSVPAEMRVGIEGAQGTAIHTAIVRPDGSVVIFPKPRPGRRRSVGSPGSPRVITLDGLDNDWSGLGPLFEGIAAGGSPSLRLIKVTAFSDVANDQLYFLFHANLSADAPFATDDEFGRPAGDVLLAVPAPGVLENDGDPSGLPLTATPVSPASRGTVTLNPDGSFTYTPNDPSSTEDDTFEYKATNGTKESNTATVTITVDSAGNDQPNAVNDAYPANEDEPLNVAAPGVLGNDTDSDGDTLTATVLAVPANGSVVLNANGGFTYTPNANFFGTDTFTYTVSDGTDTDTATVTITIASVNDAPDVDDETFSVPENSPAGTTVGTVDVDDADAGDSHTFSITAGNTGNAFAIDVNTGEITVATPAAIDFETAQQFILTVRADDDGVPSHFGTGTITINVTDANDAPTAADSSATGFEDVTLIVPAPGVLAGATDPDGDSLTAVVVSNPANGTLTLNADGSYEYEPNANFNGTDSFTFRANDGSANSDPATVTITVTPVNDAPSFNDGSDVTVFEDSGAFSAASATSISAGPADESGQSLTFTVTNDNNALFSVQPALASNGTLTFTPAANANGTATITMTLSDDGGVANGGADTSAAQTLTITVTAVNDAPLFTAGASQSAVEDSAAQTVNGWATGIAAGPADEAGQTVSFTATNDNNALFSVQPAIAPNGTLTYTPAADASGVATVSVTLTDNGGVANGGVNTSAAQNFTITITGVNDAPVNVVPGGQNEFEDVPLVFSTANGNAISMTDIDAGTGNVQAVVAVTNGTLTAAAGSGATVTNDGTASVTLGGTLAQINAALDGLTFTPTNDYVGVAQITFTSNDLGQSGAGVPETDVDNVTITITAVNDAPVFTSGGDVTVNEDSGAYNAAWATGVAPGPADEAAQTVTFAVSNDNNALFSAQPAIAADGTLTFTPAANAFGSAVVTVTLSDDGGTANGGVDTTTALTFTINVTGVNDVPSFTSGGNVTVLEDSAAYSAAWASGMSAGTGDPVQALSFNVSNDNNALFSVQPAVAADGTLTFTLAANANGTATVTVSISDDGGTANGGVDTSATQNFTLTVTAVNDVPSFTKGADVTVLEDSGAYTAAGWATALSAGPADEAGQTLSFNVTNDNNALFSVQPAVDASGQLTFTPAANAFGTATITISISDNGGTTNGGVDTSATQTFTVNVTGVNDAPSFTSGGDVTVLEDSAAYSAAWATGLDAGPGETGQTFSFNVSNDNNALFSVQPAVAADGTLTFTLAANANGTATVTVSISDNGGTANGGVDTSATQNFTLTVTAINDVPSFTKGADVTVLEDSGAYTAAGWATALSAGPADEAGQTLSFNVSNDNNALFSAQPAVDASGQLTFTPTANAFGTATVTVSISDDGGTTNGGVDTSATQTFTITITGVNDVPSFTSGGDVTVLEDSAAYSAAWATGLDAGPGETGQTFSFNVSNDNNALFSVQPAVAADGTLTFTLAANANGAATVTVSISDNGGTANGGVDTSATQNFTLTVTAINDVPSFTKGADVTVLEDSGAYTAAGWATALSAGPADEAGQTLSFNVSNDNNALFSAQPAVDASGQLTFTPTANAFGTATVTISISDNGGTTNGGVDTSATQTFTINVTGVNDVPSFTSGGDVTVLEDSAAYSAAWATGLDAGPGESGQTFSFNVSNDNNALFSVQPAVSATGTLTFTLAANANGAATVTVSISDNGGVANGGVDTSAGQNFTLTVTAVNDVPSFTKGADVTVLEDSGAYTEAGWATALSAGPADEAGQTLSFNVSNDNNALFSAQPAVDASGQLTFTPTANAFGTATVTISISDNGGTTNGGVDTSADQTFTITITGVNDVPSFTSGGDVTVLEDSSAYSAAWATGLSAGPGEGSQTLSFNVSNNNNALFSVQPAVSATGTLTFTLAANANGAATVTVSISDDGGTDDGGVDTSATQNFTLTVTAVNDAPNLGLAGDLTVLDTSGNVIAPNYANPRNAGPANESGQTLTFTVTNDNNAIFSTQPSINVSNGFLTFTTITGVNGVANVTVKLKDDGGVLNGGVDETTMTFVINVHQIPLFTSANTTSFSVGQASNFDVTVDARPTAVFSIVSPGVLPSGLTLVDDGDNTARITGTPATGTQGTYNFTLRAVNSAGQTDQAFTLIITCPVAVFNPAAGALPAGTYNQAYTQAIDVGTPGYTYAITAGALPANITLDANNGGLSGTPSTTGNFSFTITATETASGCTTDAAYTLTINPSAVNDSYGFTPGSEAVGNTQLVVANHSSPTTPFVAFTGTLLANDSAPGGATALAGTFATTGSGSVTIAADGSFTYTPAAGFTGDDTFTYTLQSNGASALGTATVRLANKVWFVKNDSAAGGTGLSSLPFDTLAEAETASAASDIIYVMTGNGGTTGHEAGITLKSMQHLIGAGVPLVVNGHTLAGAGTKPQITNLTAASDAVTLHDGNSVRGLTITGATRDGIAGSTHAGFTGDALAIQNNAGSGLHLTSMTGGVTVTNATITGNGIGLDVNNGVAAITLDATNTITANAGQRSVSVQNRPVGAALISLNAPINDSGTGILVNNNAAGTVTFAGSQTLNTTTNPAVTLTTNGTSTINFTGTLAVTTTTGSGLVATGGGTLTVSGTANVTTGAAAAGVNINGVTSGGITFNSLNTTGATTGLSLTSLGNGNVTINGGTLGAGTGVSLNTLGTSNITLNNVTVTATTTGISGTTFGTLTIAGTVPVSGPTALSLNGGTVSGTFSNVSSTGGVNGVTLTGVSGTWGATAGSLTGASGATFNVSGGSGQITWGGTIAQANASRVVSVAGSNSATINFNGNVTSSPTSTGVILTASSGIYNFNATNSFTGASGILISNGQSGTISFSNATTIGNVTNAAFQVDGSATPVTAAITYGGTIAKTGGGFLIDVNNLDSPGTLSMTHTPAAAGNLSINAAGSMGISVVGSSSTNITIANASVTFQNAGPGFTSTNNTGGTINLQGLALAGTGNRAGMLLAGAGTINVTSGVAAPVINMTGASNNAIDGTTTAFGGTLNLNNTAITGGGAPAVRLGGGTLSGTGSTIAAGAQTALNLSGVALANGAGLNSVTSTGGTSGVILANVTGGTYTISGGSLTGHTTAAWVHTNSAANAATISFSGPITPAINARAIDIGTAGASTGLHGGTITFSGNITTTSNAANANAGGIRVRNSTAGTLTLSGTTISIGANANVGIDLTTNPGATFNFSGGNLSITSTNANGLNATDGGTVNITGDDNTITNTGSGRAINFAGTSAAAKMGGTLRFKSVNKSGSGTKGIVVNNYTGSFTITGDDDNNGVPDSATAGGTITGTTTRGAEFVTVDGGVNLGGMTFTNTVSAADGGSEAICGSDLIGNDNTPCNAAIHLQSIDTSSVLRNITVNGSTQTGINGTSVRALTLNGVSVQNCGSVGVAEHGATLRNLLGTNVITNSTFSNNAGRGLYIINTLTEATDPTVTITSSTFSNSGSLQGALFDSYNSGDYTVNVGDDTVGGANTFSGNFSNALQQSVGLGGDLVINIRRNTFNHTVSGIVLQAAGVGSQSTLNYTIWNNTVVKMNGTAANGSGAIIVSGTQQHQISGDIRNNTIGNGTAGSGAFCGGGCNGITVDHNDISAGGGGRHDVTIVGNDVRNVDSSGIRVVVGQKSKGNVVVTGNRVRDPHNAGGVTTFSGIYVQGGIDASSTSCLAATIGGTTNPGTWPSTSANAMNSIEGSWDPLGFQSEIFIWRKGGTLNIPGSSAPVDTFVGARNNMPDATGPDVTVSGAIGSAATCP